MGHLKAKKCNIWAQKQRSGRSTWKAFVGIKPDGKRDVRSFATEAEAQNFRAQWNATLVEKNPNLLSDLSDISRNEVLTALARLKSFDSTIPEAVDFFIKYSRPEKARISVEEALRFFVQKKTKLGRSKSYLTNCQKTYYGPFVKKFARRVVSEITPTEAEKYIDSKKGCNTTSRNSHVNYLRAFYNFLIKEKFAKLNPFQNIEKGKSVRANSKVLKVEEVKQLLQTTFDAGYKAECACMALTLFCGVRIDETSRLKWDNIDLKNGRFVIDATASKIGKRFPRGMTIAGWEWLKVCAGTGRIAPSNFTKRMQRARRRAKIKYPQNAMRHSFISYHLHCFGDASKTANMVSHNSPDLLYKTYYDLVSDDDAKRFFEIYPAQVVERRDFEANQAEKLRDFEAKRSAEENSNCGEAAFFEGRWVPVTKTN